MDVKILIGDGPTNDAFVVCPVDDRYGAATYKIWCGIRYAYFSQYDLVIKVDDDLPVKNFHFIYDWIIENYDVNLYAGLSCERRKEEVAWDSNIRYAKRVANESYPVILSKMKVCNPIGGSFYMLGKNSMKSIALNENFLLHRREDNGISCLLSDVTRICPHDFGISLNIRDSWIYETSGGIIQQQQADDVYERFYKTLPNLTVPHGSLLKAIILTHEQLHIQEFDVSDHNIFLGYNPKFLNNSRLLPHGYIQFPVADHNYEWKLFDVMRYATVNGFEYLYLNNTQRLYSKDAMKSHIKKLCS